MIETPSVETKASSMCGYVLYVGQSSVFLLELLNQFFLSSVKISSHLEGHHSNWKSYLQQCSVENLEWRGFCHCGSGMTPRLHYSPPNKQLCYTKPLTGCLSDMV